MRHKFSDINAYLIEAIHWYNLDLPEREIFLLGETDSQPDEPIFKGAKKGSEEPGVDFVMANRLIRNLRLLNTQNNDPILIHLLSCGGDCAMGFSIYDAIKASPSPITMLNYAHARSMSSIIFQAADHRVMMPNSCFMYHAGFYGISDRWEAVRTQFKWDERYDKLMLDIYATCMTETEHSKYHKQDKKKIIRMLKRNMEKKIDVFLTAEEAVEQGFADEIFGGTAKDWEELKNYGG